MINESQLDPAVTLALRGEVEDMLDAGRVGLYEFVQFIPEHAGLSPEDELRHARAVLEELLTSGQVRLVWDFWSGDRPPEDATGVVPTQRDFEDPPQDRFLAVVRVENEN